jgi:hypothetical protein
MNRITFTPALHLGLSCLCNDDLSEVESTSRLTLLQVLLIYECGALLSWFVNKMLAQSIFFWRTEMDPILREYVTGCEVAVNRVNTKRVW